MSETIRVTLRRRFAVWLRRAVTGHQLVPNGYGDSLCRDCPFGLPDGWYWHGPGVYANYPKQP